MSKNIVFVNGGVTETWEDIAKIQTKNVDGTTIDWRPEDDFATGTITITANGEYDAEDDGLFGYSKAIVNVPDAVRGMKDGTEYIVTVDDNGDLVETPVEE